MSRKLSYSAHFPFEPKLIYDTVTHREFWEVVIQEFRVFTPDASIVGFHNTETGTDVILKQILPHEFLPPIAQSIMRFDMVITREDHFGLLQDNKAEGTFTASVPAGPGWLKGWQEIFPAASGSTLRKTAEVKVYVPFIGSKLEQLILVNLVELAKAEAEFITTYIYRKLGLNPADYPESYGESSKYFQPDRATFLTGMQKVFAKDFPINPTNA